MKLEYKIFHRIIFKNGRIGDWVYDTTTQSRTCLDITTDVNRETATRNGRKVEHRVMIREVSEWVECSLDEIIKSKDNKEVSNG